jgi:hypothetical protein
MAWITSGVVTDPTDNAVLLDSGPLTSGVFVLPLLLMSTDFRRLVRIEWRNAANNSNKQSHIFIVDGSQIFDLSGRSITVLVGERVRLVTIGEVEGKVQATALT